MSFNTIADPLFSFLCCAVVWQEGTPASKSDLVEGDRILSVNGTDVSHATDSEDVIKRIREVGEDVHLVVASNVQPPLRTVVLDKAK